MYKLISSIGDNMFCPNCGNMVNFDNFCTNCGVALAYCNNDVFLKDDFLSVKESHEAMDNFLLTAEESNNSLVEELSNPQFYIDLENNPKEKEEFLKNLEDAEDSLIDFRDTIYEVKDDIDKLNFFRCFNNSFGDADIKMNKCLNIIEDNLNYINEYRDNINNFNSNNINYDSNNIDVQDFHRQIDIAIENAENINNDLSNKIKNKEILEELRTEQNNREMFKNNIKGSLNDVLALKEKIENYLKDKEIMNQLHKEDYKYGNIEDKMIKCINEINISLNHIKELDSYVEKLETEPEKTIPLNNKRILDL